MPVSYHAHDASPLALDDTMTTNLVLDLGSAAALPTGLISGSVTSTGSGSRVNAVFVRFVDDAAVQVVDHGSPADAFSYLVPSVPNSSITVAAMRGTQNFPPFTVAYADGLTPGTSNIALTVPTPATLVSPASGATHVDETTVFTWTGAEQVYMFVARATGFTENYYVITIAKQASIPVLAVTSPPYRSNAAYTWSVRTHRVLATMDEATGPDGYLDAYCYGRLRGPHRGDGTHTETAPNGFTSKP